MREAVGAAEMAVAEARAQGALATRNLRAQLFGSRRPGGVNGDQAYELRPAIGIAPHSVFSGPPRAFEPGAPVLRRAKLA